MIAFLEAWLFLLLGAVLLLGLCAGYDWWYHRRLARCRDSLRDERAAVSVLYERSGRVECSTVDPPRQGWRAQDFDGRGAA